MRRGTTPTITVTAPVDLTDYTLYLTFAQVGNEVTLTNKDMTVAVKDGKTTITATLTQEQTLAWQADEDVRVQLRCKSGSGAAAASTIVRTPMEGIIKEGVI